MVLILSLLANTGLAIKLNNVLSNPTVKVEYKEIEVVRKAMCECDHPSSMHTDTGGCQQEMFKLDGHTVKKSYKCFCQRYVGPEPIIDMFDQQMRQLESVKQ
jgi:hypothetical protein